MIAGDDFQLADRALDALAVWRPAHAIETLAVGLRSPSSNRRAAATQALSQLDEPGTREMLRYVLSRGTGREAAAAAAGLAELGDERDVPALLKAAKRLHWPVPGTAAYALARIAARGVWKPHSARARAVRARALARTVRARQRRRRACRALGAAHAKTTARRIRWHGSARNTRRSCAAAAAHWATRRRREGRIDAGVASAALERCAASDVESSVRAACAAPPATVRGYEATDVYAYGRDGIELLRNALVAIELADGTTYLGRTDHNGHVRLRQAARGPLQLQDPGLVPLEPIQTKAPR